MVKKQIKVNEGLWFRFEQAAVAKFGLYGAITKAIAEAIEDWVKDEEEREEK